MPVNTRSNHRDPVVLPEDPRTETTPLAPANGLHRARLETNQTFNSIKAPRLCVFSFSEITSFLEARRRYLADLEAHGKTEVRKVSSFVDAEVLLVLCQLYAPTVQEPRSISDEQLLALLDRQSLPPQHG